MVLFSGALVVRATVAGAGLWWRTLFSSCSFWRACGGGPSSVRAGCGAGVAACGLGVPRLRRQARCWQRNFVRTSDDSSLSSPQFESVSAPHTRRFCSHPPLFGLAHGVDVMNSCGVMHVARVNSLGLHPARGNSGRHANSYWCTYNSCGGVR